MPRSNSCVFEVALGGTAKHAVVTDSLTLNRHTETRTKRYFTGSTVPPIRRNLKFRGFRHCAAKFA